MAVSEEQTAVWVALKAQTGGKQMLTTQHQRRAQDLNDDQHFPSFYGLDDFKI